MPLFHVSVDFHVQGEDDDSSLRFSTSSAVFAESQPAAAVSAAKEWPAEIANLLGVESI